MAAFKCKNGIKIIFIFLIGINNANFRNNLTFGINIDMLCLSCYKICGEDQWEGF